MVGKEAVLIGMERKLILGTNMGRPMQVGVDDSWHYSSTMVEMHGFHHFLNKFLPLLSGKSRTKMMSAVAAFTEAGIATCHLKFTIDVEAIISPVRMVLLVSISEEEQNMYHFHSQILRQLV